MIMLTDSNFTTARKAARVEHEPRPKCMRKRKFMLQWDLAKFYKPTQTNIFIYPEEFTATSMVVEELNSLCGETKHQQLFQVTTSRLPDFSK